LASGLDTTSLISQLMQVEAIPQNLLKTQSSSAQSMISALQGLNGKVASLATLATAAGKADSLELFSASSSSTAVTATAGSGAASGSIDLVVGATAQSQVSVSDKLATWPVTTFTITSPAGTATTINSSTNALDDVVTAVNNSTAGVTALKVATGEVDGSGNALYRLQFSASATGVAAGFTVSDATLTQIKPPVDAKVTLYAGTAAAQDITSSTNTFTNLLPGVSVNVTAASADPVTLSVARDTGRMSNVASNLVSALNGVFASISTQSAVVNSTDSTGAPKVSGGVFTGEGTVRDVNQNLVAAASMPVGSSGRSPSEIGISIQRDGSLQFDSAKFTAAMAADPVKTKADFQELATRVANAANLASDKYTGNLTTDITGQQARSKDLTDQISTWDQRLADRQAALKQTYATLEVTLSKMQSQSAWLTSQLSGMSSGSNSA
jgi:flagellar hook-associated protein 2